jgi:hypothetical protein
MVMVYDDLWSGYVWICLDGMALDHFGSFWIILDDDSATDSATILDNSKLAIPRGLKSSLNGPSRRRSDFLVDFVVFVLGLFLEDHGIP